MKQHLKSFVAGIMVGAIGLTTVFAAGSIKTATFNENQVIYNGQTLSLSQPMVSVVKEGEKNASNYMPVRAVLEAMGYTVDWDSSRNAVVVNGDGNKNTTILDPEKEKEVEEFVKMSDEAIKTNMPEIAQALEDIKNEPEYEMLKETFGKLDPITLIILAGEDYQGWLQGKESLFEGLWETLAQY